MKRYSTPFGVIKSVRQAYSGSSVYITNEQGHEVMMSHKFPYVNGVFERCKKAMENQNEVNIITSTHTNNWSSTKYFCDIEEK